MTNKIQLFNNFLNEMKSFNPSLMESIQTGFNICYEALPSDIPIHNSQWLYALVTQYTDQALDFLSTLYDTNVNKSNNALNDVRTSIYNILKLIYDEYSDEQSAMSDQLKNGIKRKFDLALNYIKHAIDDSIPLTNNEFDKFMYQYDRYDRINKLKSALKTFMYTDDGLEGNEDGTMPSLDI